MVNEPSVFEQLKFYCTSIPNPLGLKISVFFFFFFFFLCVCFSRFKFKCFLKPGFRMCASFTAVTGSIRSVCRQFTSKKQDRISMVVGPHPDLY